MDIDSSAQFLVSAVLMGLGFCVIVIALVFINNVFHKYWKPVTIWVPSYMAEPRPPRFATDEEMNKIAPSMDKEPEPVDLSKKRQD